MKRPFFYSLIGQTPVPIDMPPLDTPEGQAALEEWAASFGIAGHRVMQDRIGPYVVSTIFLGIDYTSVFDPEAPPLLFETALFDTRTDDCDILGRCSTWSEAEEQHREAVEAYQKAWEQQSQEH